MLLCLAKLANSYGRAPFVIVSKWHKFGRIIARHHPKLCCIGCAICVKMSKVFQNVGMLVPGISPGILTCTFNILTHMAHPNAETPGIFYFQKDQL